ncbi:MAG: archease [Thermodesulfobacteriota bacterium]
MNYTYIDHTADVGVHVKGTTPADLFSNAAEALFDQLVDRADLREVDSRRVRIIGEDRPDLMVNWLRELLYLWAGEDLLIKRVGIDAVSESELAATLFYEPYDPERHEIKEEIKAVTYYGIRVDKTAEGWEAEIIFDV